MTDEATVRFKRRPRQPRKPTLASQLRQAKKAGLSVKGATIEPDKVTLIFGEPAKDDGNPWDIVLSHDTKNN